MIINGLIIGGAVLVAALGIWGTSLLLRRDDAPAVDADVHVARLKYGNTWGAQRIRAQLIAVGKLIEVADQQAPWPHHQLPIADGTAARTTTSPAAPDRRTGYYVAGRDWPAIDSGIPVEDLLQALERIPETSPATPPAPAPGHAPGTAAAAGGSPPPASPPPLPDPAYAAAHPGCWPLGWLQDDQFVTDWTARALAETETLVKASYYKPLDGA